MKELLEQALLEMTENFVFTPPNGIDRVEYMLENWTVSYLCQQLAHKLEEKGVIIPPTAEQAEEASDDEYYSYMSQAGYNKKAFEVGFLAGYNYATHKP